MSDIAIKVENLSKLYRIGTQQESYRTLRDTLAGVASAPLRHIRSTFKRSDIQASQDSDEFWALRDVSFEVRRGEVVGIIGRNGAGKSTLLKILSRITEPTSGYADIYGRVGSLLEVGTGFHPELTGRENVYLNGAILGMRRAEIDRQFDAIVAFAEVERFVDTPVKHYSSGMYLRLAFAVAAHLDPEILIVDEVLAVGDAEFQKKCLGKMGEVAREGRTVLLVSHNIASIRTLCLHGLWLDRGEIVRLGDVQTVTDSYLQSAYVGEQTEVDLVGIVRPSGYGDRARLTHVDLNKGSMIQHGEALSVFLHYESSIDVEDVALGIGFSSPEGIRILSIDSDMGPNKFSFIASSNGVLEMYMDKLPLQPGHYMVDLGIRSRMQGLDYLPCCFQVEVLPGPSTPPHLIRRDGGVRFAADWRQI